MTSFERKTLPSESPPPPSLKDRRRPHLKPLRIAPTTPAQPAPPTPTTAALAYWKNTDPRHPSPSSLPSTPYTTSASSSLTSATTFSATSSTSATPTFDQKITYGNHLPQKQKRRRRSPEEFAELMSIFEKTPKPCRQLREHLSRRLNMSIREVQIWFQNQRAKISRQARLTPSATSTSNGSSISSPTRRNTYSIGDDGYGFPMTAIGLVHAHPYGASPYRQATYPPFLDHSTNAHNRPDDQALVGNPKAMIYPASPVSVNDQQASLSTYYGEGATLPATTGSIHQRSQSQPQLFSYSNYNMDDGHRHPHHIPLSYRDSHPQRYSLTAGDRSTSFASSVPVTPTSSSPCSISSSEERRKVTDEEVQTFADAMALLAEVAAQDQTQQDPSKFEKEHSCKEYYTAPVKTMVEERSQSPETGTHCNESRESEEATILDNKNQMAADIEGKESPMTVPEGGSIAEDGVVNLREPVLGTNEE